MTQRWLVFLIIGALLLGAASVATSGERLIQVLSRQSVPERKQFVCPCEFDLGKDMDGEVGLIIDHNAEGQHAYAKIDGDVIRFKNTDAFRFRCGEGEKISGVWATSGVKLSVALVTDGAGEESCWFRGEMSVAKGNRRETREIVGGCGC